jgi:hypothetical protein
MPAVVGDGLGVVTQNAGGNKIDTYLRRTVDYTTRIDPDTGRVQAHAVLTLHNDAPPRGAPLYVIGNQVGLPNGTHRCYLSVYSPFALHSATLEGRPRTLLAERELGWNVYSEYVDIPPKGTRIVALDFDGVLDLRSHRYRFDSFSQVLPNPDSVRWTLDIAGKARVVRAKAGPSAVRVVSGRRRATTRVERPLVSWNVEVQLRR